VVVVAEHRRGDVAAGAYECVFQEPSGTSADGRFLYEDGWQRGGRAGSWPAFLGALLAGFGVVGLALRRQLSVPKWLRLAAVTTLAFAVAGVGAFVGGWQFSVVVMTFVGVPVAFAADRWLRPGRRFDHPWTAGPTGAAVAFSASAVASTGWLFGLGLTAYGLTVLLVAAVAALPRWRSPPSPVPAR
jgi:hypothetical protein